MPHRSTSRFPFETDRRPHERIGFSASPFEASRSTRSGGKTRARHSEEAFRVIAPLRGGGEGWILVLSMDLGCEIVHARVREDPGSDGRPRLDMAFWKRVPVDEITRHALRLLIPKRVPDEDLAFLVDFDPHEIRFDEPRGPQAGRPGMHTIWMARAASLYVNRPELTVPGWGELLGVSAPRAYAIRTRLYEEDYMIDIERGGFQIPELTDKAWHLITEGDEED